MAVFVIFNCKNKETQPEEIVVPEKTKTEVLQETETTSKVSTFEKEVEQSESIELTQTTTSDVTKTKTVPVKVENTVKTATKPIVEKETEEQVEVKTKTPVETKTEVEINTPVETKAEPIVTEALKSLDLNTWKVPAKYVTMKNPIPAKQDAAIGKSLYDKHCKSCHGKEGYGDGPKAADLNGNLGDFSSTIFQKQTDGELFYKTTMGRDDMPEFTKKLPDDEDRWLIINYMRTLKE